MRLHYWEIWGAAQIRMSRTVPNMLKYAVKAKNENHLGGRLTQDLQASNENAMNSQPEGGTPLWKRRFPGKRIRGTERYHQNAKHNTCLESSSRASKGEAL